MLAPKHQRITNHAASAGAGTEDYTECAVQVYVLRLQQGKYYVGKTKNLKRRLREHKERGAGCAEWTKIYPMIDRVPCSLSYQPGLADSDEPATSTQETGDANAIERAETLYQIKLHGIENVRGSKWSSVELTEEQKAEAMEAVRELEDRCYLCDAVGHLQKDCPKATNNA